MDSSTALGRLQGWTGGNVHLMRLAAVIIAFIGCAIVWLIADPIAGANLRAEDMNGDLQTINLGALFLTVISYCAVAWIVLLLIQRFTPRPRQIWIWVSVIILVLSLIPPFTAADNTETSITLAIMHIVAGAVVIPIFASTLPEQRGGPVR